MASSSVSPDARRTVDDARGGDESAWRELFDEHYPKLIRFFRSRVASSAIAEDLAAETFADAYRGINKFQWRERPFGAWVFGIARNRLRMHDRSRREHEQLPDELEHVRDEYLDIEIRDALEHLEPDHRAAIEYRYILGLTGEEAAAAMGRSHGAFRALLHRATTAFKSEYGELAP
jgi:RNA polymerase sigma-70 factor, ECF subfamily